MAIVDGQRVKVGEWICFKSDIEQSGRVQAVLGGNRLVLTNSNGFQGHYIGGLHSIIRQAEDCWRD